MDKGKAALFYVLIPIGALLWGTTYGQEDSFPLYFDHLTINEGLSHNTVFDVLQDRDGYLWIATQNGLNKYDGYSFELFIANSESEKREGFLGKIITALHEDYAGNLWVGTRNNGLNVRWRGQDQFLNLTADPSFTAIRGFEISSITDDGKGTIWITTVGAGVLSYQQKTGATQHFTQRNSGLSDDLAFDLAIDSNDRIWVATAGLGLNVLDTNGRFQFSHEPEAGKDNMSGYRKTLFVDSDYIWLGTEGSGAYRIHANSREYTQFSLNTGEQSLSSRVVRDVIRGADGRIYFATDGTGLNVYDEELEQISYYRYQVGEPLALNSNALYCFWEDQIGNLWIGTYNGGLNVFKKNKTYFEFLTPEIGRRENLGHRSILAIHQRANGPIWIGTDGGGLNQLQEQEGAFSFSTWRNDPSDLNSIRGNAVKCIFEDSRGQLWISLFGIGLDVFNPQTGLFRAVEVGANTIWSIAEQKDGTLWLGTLDEGLLAIEPETGRVLTSADLGFPLNLGVMTVFVDDQDQLWVGSADDGLSRWDPQQKQFVWFQHQPEDSCSISSNEIRTLFQDSRGQLRIGTEGGGMNRWLGGACFEHITQAEGLLANSVMGIMEDDEGFIWATTFTGISRMNPGTQEIRNFNFRTGEQSNQFNQMAVLNSAAGRLFFGGINGLNTTTLNQVKDQVRTPKIIFSDLRVFNRSITAGPLPNRQAILQQPIELADDIWLLYSDNSFALEFTTTDYTEPDANVFRYKMEGFDNYWQSVANGRHSANYTNLNPGTYTFIVKCKESSHQLTIHIAPPYWQTIWFRLVLLVLMISLILGGGYLMLKRREEAHQQQLLQLKNENLMTEVNAQNSKLLFSSAQMARNNEILIKIKKELKEIQRQSDVKLGSVLHIIDSELKSEDYWQVFNQYVEQVDQDFSQMMLEQHPNLTPNDLRLCTLLRLNLSTKEIASLLNISIRGVEQSRYRLKKRLGLEGTADLIKYISTIK